MTTAVVEAPEPTSSASRKMTLATIAASAALLGGFAATIYVMAPKDSAPRPPVSEERRTPASPDETPLPTETPAPAIAPAVPQQPTVITTSPAAPTATPAEAPRAVTPTTLHCTDTPSRPC